MDNYENLFNSILDGKNKPGLLLLLIIFATFRNIDYNTDELRQLIDDLRGGIDNE